MCYNEVMQIRKDPLENGYVYHIFSRSIAKYIIFNNDKEYSRFLNTMILYHYSNFIHKYCKFKLLPSKLKNKIVSGLIKDNNSCVEIIAYCLMPTHIHLVLKQIQDNGISIYMSKILNSYARFFNTAHKRSGALWSGRFKNVLIGTDEQLLHLTRYIHLNPTSIGLAENPEDWHYSSYLEYINKISSKEKICKYQKLIDIPSVVYNNFVNDRKDYQKEITKIKSILIENYTG